MDVTPILLSPPSVGGLEGKYVLDALESGWVAPLGPAVSEFETKIAALCQREFGVAVSSGTAGLHLSLLSVGVRAGDVVIVSSLTFVATGNAVLYVGAEPWFVDAEPDSGNMSTVRLREALERAHALNRRVGAVMPADFLGKMCDLEKISSICDLFSVPLVVDAAESLGSSRGGKPSGSFGLVSVFSFNGNKILTTSSGGMIVTNDSGISERVRFLASQSKENVSHYEHKEIGFNYRMSNILAAVGLAQFEKLDKMVAARRWIRAGYRELFSESKVLRVHGALSEDNQDNCWLTAVQITPESGLRPADLIQHLKTDLIESRFIWKPLHLQPLFRGALSFESGVANSLFSSGVLLPSGSGMSADDLGRVAQSVLRFAESA